MDLPQAVRTMSRRFAELAAGAPDPDREVAATPGWNITDVLGHVASEPARYDALARGGGTWPEHVTGLPTFNAEQIRTLPTRDRATLAAGLLADTEALLATIAEFGDAPPMMNFDGNQLVRADRALGTLLGEFVVHGLDIARTVGRPWHIDAELVPMVLAGTHQVMPGWLDANRARTHTGTYELRLRGLGARHIYAVRNGALTVDPDFHPQIDVHISAEPVAWLLQSYGRGNRWTPALTGRIVVWGRKIWLAPTFSRLFHPA